ncbi:MAG: YbhB/YbcL family Raf kinase inhibitor-like protein [Leptospirales bacterium]
MKMNRWTVVGLFSILMMSTGSFAQSSIKVTSTDFRNGGKIGMKQVFSGFGCSGGNVSPEIRWRHLPKGTKSIALTTYDPDAPTGSGWWHWVVYNLPPSVSELKRGEGSADGGNLPAGAIQAVTDFGKKGYGGPCPPKGDRPHHYIFTVYALKVAHLDLPPNASPALIGYYLHMNMIGKGTIVGRYGH